MTDTDSDGCADTGRINLLFEDLFASDQEATRKRLRSEGEVGIRDD